MANVLIIGATSAIAEATARIWAKDQATLYLLARNPYKLALVCSDLQSRGARVQAARFDADQIAQHEGVIETAFAALGRVDLVLLAYGDLPDQRECEMSTTAALAAVQTNVTSQVSLLTLIANRMQEQRKGVIAVIGSVAGDRGRKSNYVYGACKAFITAFMEGLAGRLHASGVRVITIKPGFVDTPMTASFKKGLLWAHPRAVAKIIHVRTRSAHSGAYYAPRFWRPIMTVIRLIPRRMLYRLSI